MPFGEENGEGRKQGKRFGPFRMLVCGFFLFLFFFFAFCVGLIHRCPPPLPPWRRIRREGKTLSLSGIFRLRRFSLSFKGKSSFFFILLLFLLFLYLLKGSDSIRGRKGRKKSFFAFAPSSQKSRHPRVCVGGARDMYSRKKELTLSRK